MENRCISSFLVTNFVAEVTAKRRGMNVTYKCKARVNFTLEQATKAQRGSRCKALLFLRPCR